MGSFLIPSFFCAENAAIQVPTAEVLLFVLGFSLGVFPAIFPEIGYFCGWGSLGAQGRAIDFQKQKHSLSP